VSLVAGVEEFALAVGRDGEDLAFVACGYVENAIGAESDVPDVFCFGIEEDRFFTGRGDAIDLAVGGSGHIERAAGVEGHRLGYEVGGFKDGSRFAVVVEAKNFCGRAAGSIESAFGVDTERPEIGGVGVGEQREFWSEFKAAVAADGYAVGRAFEEFFIGGLQPAAGMLGAKKGKGRGHEAKK